VAFAYHPLFLKELTHLYGIGAWKRLGHQNGEPHVSLSKTDGTIHWSLPLEAFIDFSSQRFILKSSLMYCTGSAVGTSITNLDITMRLT